MQSNDYDVVFFNEARLSEFWEIVQGLLKFASPSVLIFVAISAVGMLITLVIVAFRKGSDDSEKEYEIKYYD